MAFHFHLDRNVGGNCYHYSLLRMEDDKNTGRMHVLFVLCLSSPSNCRREVQKPMLLGKVGKKSNKGEWDTQITFHKCIH
jgi:hypothetical protein